MDLYELIQLVETKLDKPQVSLSMLSEINEVEICD